jgi:ParB family transcriptional regulator, chromosome partitioning protein
MTKSGLGRGLSSLIPNKEEEAENKKTKEFKSERTEQLEVAIGQVNQNPRQPRHNFVTNDLNDLVASVKEHGILQPLVVSVRDDGQYELIAGERRLRAAKQVGLTKVPIVTRKVTDQEKLELALIENVQRQDLNALEEALAYKVLFDEFDLSHDQIAQRVGKARPTVSNAMRLLDLPDEMKEALKDGRIGKAQARTLLSEKDPEKQKELFQSVLHGGMTVREAEAKAGLGNRRANKKDKTKDPNISDLEIQMQDTLGTKVTIQEKNGRGRIIIDFYTKSDLRKLFDKIKD